MKSQIGSSASSSCSSQSSVHSAECMETDEEAQSKKQQENVFSLFLDEDSTEGTSTGSGEPMGTLSYQRKHVLQRVQKILATHPSRRRIEKLIAQLPKPVTTEYESKLDPENMMKRKEIEACVSKMISFKSSKHTQKIPSRCWMCKDCAVCGNQEARKNRCQQCKKCPTCPSFHFHEAKKLDFPANSDLTMADPLLHAIYSQQADKAPEEIIETRRQAEHTIKLLERACRPMSNLILDTVPETIRAVHHRNTDCGKERLSNPFSIPMAFFLCRWCGYEDIGVIDLLVNGVKLHGEIESSGQWYQKSDREIKKGRKKMKTMEEIVANEPKNRKICEQATAATSTARNERIDSALMEATLLDCRRGIMAGPFFSREELQNYLEKIPAAEADETAPPGFYLEALRFGNEALRPKLNSSGQIDAVIKIRAIDNGRQSLLTLGQFCSEKMCNPTPASIAAQIQMARSFAGKESVAAWASDEVAAFRNCPTAIADLKLLTTTQFDPVSKQQCWSVLSSGVFGTRSSVYAYSRRAQMVQRLVMALAIPVLRYVDDSWAVERQSIAASGRKLYYSFIAAIGVVAQQEKDQRLSTSLVLLGIGFDTESACCYLTDLKKKCREMEIKNIIESNQLTPSAAESLSGKLNWTSFVINTACFKLALKSVQNRQYERDVEDDWKLSPALLKSLHVLLAEIKNAKPMSFDDLLTDKNELVLAYTDGAEESKHGMTTGGIVHYQNENRVFSSEVPDAERQNWKDLNNGEQKSKNIISVELYAVLQLLQSMQAAGAYKNKKCIFFVDNQCAFAQLCRCAAQCAEHRALLYHIKTVEAEMGLQVFYEYVPSQQNVSDLPSRWKEFENKKDLERAIQEEVGPFSWFDKVFQPVSTAPDWLV